MRVPIDGLYVFLTTEFHLHPRSKIIPRTLNSLANFALQPLKTLFGASHYKRTLKRGRVKKLNPDDPKLPWTTKIKVISVALLLIVPGVVVGGIARFLSLASPEINEAFAFIRAKRDTSYYHAYFTGKVGRYVRKEIILHRFEKLMKLQFQEAYDFLKEMDKSQKKYTDVINEAEYPFPFLFAKILTRWQEKGVNLKRILPEMDDFLNLRNRIRGRFPDQNLSYTDQARAGKLVHEKNMSLIKECYKFYSELTRIEDESGLVPSKKEEVYSKLFPEFSAYLQVMQELNSMQRERGLLKKQHETFLNSLTVFWNHALWESWLKIMRDNRYTRTVCPDPSALKKNRIWARVYYLQPKELS